MYENTKNNAGSLLVLAKLSTLLNPNAKVLNQAAFLKNYMIKNVKIVSLAMLLCDIAGLQAGSAEYAKKIMMLTSLMTIVGSSFWLN